MVPNSPQICKEDGPPMEPFAVSINEAARLCSISRRRLCYLLADGTIPSFKLGKRRLILTAELRAYISKLAA